MNTTTANLLKLVKIARTEKAQRIYFKQFFRTFTRRIA